MITIAKSFWTVWASPLENRNTNSNKNLVVQFEIKNPFSSAKDGFRLGRGDRLIPA